MYNIIVNYFLYVLFVFLLNLINSGWSNLFNTFKEMAVGVIRWKNVYLI